MGAQAGDFLPARVQFVERAERAFDDGGNVLEALPDAVLRELEDRLLGAVDDLFGFVGMLDGFGDGVLRDVDQPAQQRLVAHDANVVLDARPVGHAVDERRKIRDAADGLDLFAPVKLLGQRDHVHRPAHALQVGHAPEDAAMRVEREVVGLQLRSLVVEPVVEQDGAEYRALSIDAGGKPAFQTVVGGRHRRLNQVSGAQTGGNDQPGHQCAPQEDFVLKAVGGCGMQGRNFGWTLKCGPRPATCGPHG